VQRVADLLEADGLAVYETNPTHRRAMLLRPTPRGRRVLKQINTAQKAWADALGAEIGEADLRRATGVLERTLRLLERRRPHARKSR
jgi:DNA-binding MarR family transcriptional regulator